MNMTKGGYIYITQPQLRTEFVRAADSHLVVLPHVEKFSLRRHQQLESDWRTTTDFQVRQVVGYEKMSR